MKKILLLIVFITMTLVMNSQQSVRYTVFDPKVTFNLGLGISYDFNFNREIYARNDIIFIDMPLSMEFDIRFRPTVAFTTGADFIYSYHSYKSNGHNVINNSLFITVPLYFKFFPMAELGEEGYSDFYVALGLTAFFWPVNTYYYKTKSGSVSGNNYSQSNTEVYPKETYSFANVGLHLGVGNTKAFSDVVSGGIELYINYLFVPYLNGYYRTPHYYENGNVPLNFWGDIGLKIYLGFILNGNSQF